MPIVLDANVLVRSSDPDDPLHATAVEALKILKAAGEQLILIPQAVREFWAVATRPKKENGLALTPQESGEYVARFEKFFELRPDTPAAYDHWRQLVTNYAVSGKEAHDAAYVAAMQAHAIT